MRRVGSRGKPYKNIFHSGNSNFWFINSDKVTSATGGKFLRSDLSKAVFRGHPSKIDRHKYYCQYSLLQFLSFRINVRGFTIFLVELYKTDRNLIRGRDCDRKSSQSAVVLGRRDDRPTMRMRVQELVRCDRWCKRSVFCKISGSDVT
jgi:hypothetical protein